MQSEPSREHRWLDALVGEWSYEMECLMGPDQPPMTTSGTEVVRSLGGLWTVAEIQGTTPDGQPTTSMMTLGFDPAAGRFTGTFVASVMTYLWSYQGSLDADSRILTLDAEGPSFSGAGLSKYQDIIELVDDDHRIMRSQLLSDDGTWISFMTMRYQRLSAAPGAARSLLSA
ncbi:DUF1579 domain-containing protein [Tautonia marina]|uniref:DUF1579 domain-containing protein n=1 Tax=Tautonia marina TaxID=2653855 RepID=UPI001260F7AF|nr:DUF1579 domain-containing protein [Tautonia marina]